MGDPEQELRNMLARQRQDRERRRADRSRRSAVAEGFLNSTVRRGLERASGVLNDSGHQAEFPSGSGDEPGISRTADGVGLTLVARTAGQEDFAYTVRVRLGPGESFTVLREVPKIDDGRSTAAKDIEVFQPASAHGHVLSNITEDEVIRDFTAAFLSHLAGVQH